MIKLHRLRLQNFKQISKVEIAFADKGSTLIEGHNEAGKSSLFEAVFYALYGNSLTKANHVDLKRYKTDEMHVELEFSIDNRRFWVERTVRNNQKVHVKCPTADGKIEEIKTVTACNERLLLELGIGASALLNTCFVEQKQLGKLESISKSDRKETVNELLNIKELNILEERFKGTTEDKERIQQAKKRVEIAEIDALIPQVEREVVAAYRSLLCREAQERNAKRTDLQGEIEAIQRKQEANSEQIAALEKIIAQGADFEKQLKAIRDVLPLQVQAWQTAENQHDDSVLQVAELETLEQGLLLRREEIKQERQYHVDLQTLEGLRDEAQSLATELQAQEDALTAYNTLQAEWDDDEIERKQCEQTRNECKRDYDEAQKLWEARQASVQRMDRLRLLRQHHKAGTDFLTEANTLAEEQRAIIEQQAQLPEWKLRQKQGTDAQTLKQRDTEIAQEQKNRDIERSAKERQRDDAGTLQQEIGENEKRLAVLGETLVELGQQAEQAQNQRVAVECRDALIAWADAKERSLEADPETGQQDEAKQQYAAAQAQLNEARDEISEVKRKQLPNFVLLGGGVVGIIAAFVTPFLIPLLALGILLGLGGGFLLMQTRKVLADANAKTEAAQKEIAKFGVRQELAAEQATKFSQQRERRIAEEANKRTVLERLNVSLPESPAAARQQAEKSPKDSFDTARQAETDAQTAFTQAEAESKSLNGTLQRDRERFAQFDLPALIEALQNIESREAADVAERKRIAGELDALLHTLSMQDTEALAQEIAELQKQITQAESALERLPELARQENDKRTSAERENQAAVHIAQALGLGGESPLIWEHAAVAEQAVFALECEETPNTLLEQQAEMMANRLRASEQELSKIVGRQEEHKNRLDAQDRPQLATNVEATTQKQTENQFAQEKFAPVLEQLEARELPQTSAELHTLLTLKQKEFDTDTQRVAALPQKRQTVTSCAATVTLKADQFVETWRDVLPDETVPILPKAATKLESLDKEISSQLHVLNIPTRKTEREALTNHNIELGKDNAKHQQTVNTLSSEITERYRKLGIEEAAAAQEIQRDPVLRIAHNRSAEEWQTEHRTREDTLKAEQTKRKTQADNLSIPSQPLELETERTALIAAQRERDIKDCATRIVNETRRSIVSRVMPLTMANVRFLLPALTAGRYKDLKWDEDDNSLHIFDERAGEHKNKNVFSGGAKDQISLALRLGFALATLPTGKTSRPNWLFLDEPLSSFDRERTLALVDLLTKGILRQKFDQIFLISHSEAFDANLFDYHLKMENGALAHSTLPAPAVLA